MADRITKEHRSWNMSRIRSGNTKPEMIVRSMLYKMGYRFRLHGKVSKRLQPKGLLPGKPDIVLAKYKTVIFVHGCFWHGHEGCKDFVIPKTRTEWWVNKINTNKKRDENKFEELTKLGWNISIIWECETKNNNEFLIKKILRKCKNRC